MSTDWNLIRTMMETAIAACERLEALGVREEHRAAVVNLNGPPVTVFDVLTSAWTYPETLRYEIIRQRHEAGLDQPYVPESARILVNVAQACAELIDAGTNAPTDEACRKMVRWFNDHALPHVEQTMQASRDTAPSGS